MKQKLVLGGLVASLLLVGGTTLAQSPFVPPPAARAYLCFEGHGASEITQKANEAGARGWRMVSAVSQGDSSIWCFEQYRAARPTTR